MSRKARVELVVELDLEEPLEVVAMAAELEAQATAEQWEALVLLGSAVMEQASPEMTDRIFRQRLALRDRLRQ